MRTRTTLSAAAVLTVGALVGWLTILAVAREKKPIPAGMTHSPLTSAELAERTLHRRAVDAVIWGMPTINEKPFKPMSVLNKLSRRSVSPTRWYGLARTRRVHSRTPAGLETAKAATARAELEVWLRLGCPACVRSTRRARDTSQLSERTPLGRPGSPR